MSISALKEKFNSLTLESENHWDYRGNNNSERDYVHGFCTYPAMMVPKMQREMLDVCLEHLQDTSIRLLDPFAGSGTILVEGMLRGLNIVGIDINPLAILLCKAKTTILNPTTLHEKTVQLFTWITIHDKTPLYKFDGINKWFTNQAISDLSRIRAGIIAEETIEYRRFFWASFCEVVRIVSNSRDCTYQCNEQCWVSVRPTLKIVLKVDLRPCIEVDQSLFIALADNHALAFVEVDVFAV